MNRFGQDAKAVAGAVREGVKQVYWIADGADGPRGWKVMYMNMATPLSCVFCKSCETSQIFDCIYSATATAVSLASLLGCTRTLACTLSCCKSALSRCDGAAVSL